LRSPHPEAKKLLLTMWNDPYREVRVIVLEALDKMHTKESPELLKKMSHDADEGVRNQAVEYLELRTGEPK
jgi:HEAT repeat protein